MAFSADDGKGFFADWIFNFMHRGNVGSILDIGAGAGSYGLIVRKAIKDCMKWNSTIDKLIKLHAIEVFTPYIEQYKLTEIYDKIYAVDIITEINSLDTYDLIILGDILEHMTKFDAIKVFKILKSKAKFVWLSMPVKSFRPWSLEYKQLKEEWQENSYNEHKHDWDLSELEECLGPFLWRVPFPIVAVLIAEGSLK